ncbi:hypothetical protein [Aquipuribacter sp. MA13-6]|uniref:hypothetical protein n=1 Tax=unclassified Aquipuribacter TaxID=2635084 RepID=UPI003EEA52BC
MTEFRVVLDGLELDEREYALVSQAVLEAGLKAVNNLSKGKQVDFVALTAPRIAIDDWLINGGWVIRDRLAGKARDLLQEQGVLPRELGRDIGRHGGR